MTKGGYEKLDESNIENMRSSMDHERIHTDTRRWIEVGNDLVKIALWELDVIKEQRNDNTFQKTSSSYKQKVKGYEDDKKREIEIYK